MSNSVLTNFGAYSLLQKKLKMDSFIFPGRQGQGHVTLDHDQGITGRLPRAPGKINESILSFFWKSVYDVYPMLYLLVFMFEGHVEIM